MKTIVDHRAATRRLSPLLAAAAVAQWEATAQVSLTLTGVEFQGTVMDDSGNLYPSPQWTPSTSYPIQGIAGWAVGGLVDCTTSGSGTVWLQGAGSQGLVFPPAHYNVLNGQPCSLPVCSSNLLPAMAQTINAFSTTWSYSNDGINYSPLGTTRNIMYVTLNPPAWDPFTGFAPCYRTVLQKACATTAASANAAVAAIWQQFAGPANITTWDGKTLYYYAPGTTFTNVCGYTFQLLTHFNGNCFAFRNVLEDCLLVNEITTYVRIWVQASGSHYSTDLSFLVKNWHKTNLGTSGNADYPWQIFTTLTGDPPPYFEMTPPPYANNTYGDLASLIGLAGQNSATPSEKVFVNHQILAYYTIAGGSSWYDPSYGVGYSSQSPAASVESSAVYGFSTGFYPPCPTNGYWPVYVRVPTAHDGSDLNLYPD